MVPPAWHPLKERGRPDQAAFFGRTPPKGPPPWGGGDGGFSGGGGRAPLHLPPLLPRSLYFSTLIHVHTSVFTPSFSHPNDHTLMFTP